MGEHLVEASGKLVLMDQLLGYLQPLGHKVLIFSQMTRMLDIVQDYLGYRGQEYLPSAPLKFSLDISCISSYKNVWIKFPWKKVP